MPRAELNITVPDDVWIGELSRAYPDVRIRILSAFVDGQNGVGLVEITGPDVESFIEDLSGREEIADISLLSASNDEVIVQFETTMPMLLFPITGSGAPLELPFDLVDGEATWDITASHERLSRLGDQLREFEIPFTVETIRERVASEHLLTDRQQRLVTEAVNRGYYDTPRTCTLTELADALDIAKSTCSETLHRAEEKIIKQFVEEFTPIPDR